MNPNDFVNRNTSMLQLIEDLEGLIQELPDSHLGKMVYDGIISNNLTFVMDGKDYQVSQMMANRDHFQFSVTGFLEENGVKVYRNLKLTNKQGQMISHTLVNLFGGYDTAEVLSHDYEDARFYLAFKLFGLRAQDELKEINRILKLIKDEKRSRNSSFIPSKKKDKVDISCMSVMLNPNIVFFGEYEYEKEYNQITDTRPVIEDVEAFYQRLLRIRNFITYSFNKVANFFARCCELDMNNRLTPSTKIVKVKRTEWNVIPYAGKEDLIYYRWFLKKL